MILQGKNAIVTGGSIGIGTAIALEVARAGANVALNYRRHADEANAVVAEIEKMGRRSLAIQADVASFTDAEAMIKRVVKEFGSVDILVGADQGASRINGDLLNAQAVDIQRQRHRTRDI